jgi:hypothetical protein
MSMSDCEKCWETLCICGWQYRNWYKEARITLAAACLGIEYKELEKLIGNKVPENHPMKDWKP